MNTEQPPERPPKHPAKMHPISRLMLGALRINVLGGGLLLIAAIGFFPFLTQIQLKLSLSDLLPEKDPLVTELEELTELAGGVGYLVGIIEGENLEQNLLVAQEFKDKITRNPQVRYAFYEREESFFFDKLLYLQGPDKVREIEKKIKNLKKEKIKSAFDLGLDEEEEGVKDDYFSKLKKELSPQILSGGKHMASTDGKMLLVMIKPSFSSNRLDLSEKLISDSQEIFNKIKSSNHLPQFQFRFGGKYYDVYSDTIRIQKNLGWVSTVGYFATLLYVLLFYTNLRLLFALAIPLACGIALSFEIVALTLGHVNIITGFLVATLSGIGIDYGIFLVNGYAYQRERHPHRPLSKILYFLYRYDGKGIFSALIASAFAFFLLVLGSFRGFYEFGFVCSVGLLSIFACYIFMIPTILKFLPAKHNFLKLINPPHTPHFRPWAYPVLGLFFVALLFGIPKLKFEYDFEKIAGLSPQTLKLHAEMDQIFGKSLTPAIIWVPDQEKEDQVRNYLKDKSEITQFIGLSNILPSPQNQRETQLLLKRLKKKVDKISGQVLEENIGLKAERIRSLLTAQPYTFEDLPISLQNALRVDHGRLLYAYTDVPLSQIKGIRLISGIFNQMKEQLPQIKVGLEALIFNKIINQVWKDGKLILTLLFLGLFFTQLFDQRSFKRASYVIAPTILGFAVTLGAMGFFGIRFDVINVSIIPAIFGTGIDVTIMFFNYLWMTREYAPLAASSAIFRGTTLCIGTSVIGFGTLTLAQAAPLRTMGIIASMGLLAMYAVSVLWLPGLLNYLKERWNWKIG
jgi:uncharacterized protein